MIRIDGPTLAELRQQAGLTQYELADRTGIPQARISRAELGRPIDDLTRMAAALGYDLALIPRDAGPAPRAANGRCTDPACPNAAIDNHAHLSQADGDELLRQIVAAMVEDFPAEDQVSASISTLAAETVPPVDLGTVWPENGTGGDIVHLIHDSDTTRCCYREVTELPAGELTTMNPDAVTCGLTPREEQP